MEHNKIVSICQDALDNEYQYGKYDCNVVVLRLVDLIAGTDWESKCKYKTLKGGIKQLKALGVETTIELIMPVLEEVKYAIDGDLWVDPSNPHNISIVISGRLLGVDPGHTEFKLINKKQDGKYYRIRKL